jgi:hypothetical protein
VSHDGLSCIQIHLRPELTAARCGWPTCATQTTATSHMTQPAFCATLTARRVGLKSSSRRYSRGRRRAGSRLLGETQRTMSCCRKHRFSATSSAFDLGSAAIAAPSIVSPSLPLVIAAARVFHSSRFERSSPDDVFCAYSLPAFRLLLPTETTARIVNDRQSHYDITCSNLGHSASAEPARPRELSYNG